MICPKCGSVMNRHAEKPLTTADRDEPEVIAAIHACPNCGNIEEVIQPLRA